MLVPVDGEAVEMTDEELKAHCAKLHAEYSSVNHDGQAPFTTMKLTYEEGVALEIRDRHSSPLFRRNK